MRRVVVLGVGMTRFGKFPQKSLKDLIREAVSFALEHAGISKEKIEAAYVSNSMAGIMTGQESIRGQVWLSPLGIDKIPIFNVENACASASSAFHLGWLSVASGLYDCVLAVGAEKLFDKDKTKSFIALGTAVDIEKIDRIAEKVAEAGLGEAFAEGTGVNRSIFMDFYGALARFYMREFGLEPEHFGKISVKNHYNGSLNPHAQYRKPVTLEEVMNSPMVSYPLTRLMCAPISDGAAAAVIASESFAREMTDKLVYVAASANGTGMMDVKLGEPGIVRHLITMAYEQAGLGPHDLDIVEVHDATTVSELSFMLDLGVCESQEVKEWIDKGWTGINGKVAFNTSGGLVSKGHPVGATGLGMIAEVVWQLRGEAGERQVDDAQVGLTLNGGGVLGAEPAAMSIHIFHR
jgi:acetyl-CoA acetyltransferase